MECALKKLHQQYKILSHTLENALQLVFSIKGTFHKCECLGVLLSYRILGVLLMIVLNNVTYLIYNMNTITALSHDIIYLVMRKTHVLLVCMRHSSRQTHFDLLSPCVHCSEAIYGSLTLTPPRGRMPKASKQTIGIKSSEQR